MLTARRIGLLLAALASAGGTVTAQTPPGPGPVRIDVPGSATPDAEPLRALVRDVRSHADAFVFLSGGASKMAPDVEHELRSMFESLADIAKTRRIAVGDGGTHAGIMRAAGEARRHSGDAFPLIGVTPAREIPPAGETPVDPHHSHLVAVADHAARAGEGWGTETDTMYRLFAALAAGRPSVTVVANGGAIVLREVEANLRAGRRMILIEGSGRAADALVSLIRHGAATSPDIGELRARAASLGLGARPELFTIVPLSAGAAGLREALVAALQ